jgi:CBS domain containing-hemolysin-like protein
MILPALLAVFLLIGVNAFFAAAEFSLVAVRHSRLRQMARPNDPRVRLLEELLGDMSRVVSGVQVGITLASLALGYIGEVTLGGILQRSLVRLPGHATGLVAHSLALGAAFALLTVFQVVLGELVPKTISLARAERVALLVARPFHWFLNTFSWAIDALDGLASIAVRAMGVPSAEAHSYIRSAEELQALIDQARERGVLQAGEQTLMQRVLELRETPVKKIMVPRPDVHALPATASLEEALQLFITTQRSRLPIYEGSLDHVLGFLHVKDLMWALADRLRRAGKGQPEADFHLRSMLREALIVPETKPASELLVEFRTRRIGLAMVVDEFGSILGMVTLEDILEEMVGEIHDEFDVIRLPQRLPDGSLVFDASLKVRDLETQFGITLPDDTGYETVGGFVLAHLGFIPRGGESFKEEDYRFTVVEMDHRRVSRVRILRQDAAATTAPLATAPPSSPGTPSAAAPPASANSQTPMGAAPGGESRTKSGPRSGAKS